MEKTSRVLITGAHGMLGRHIIEELARLGYTQLLCPSRTEMDLLNAFQTSSYITQSKPEYIFHCAGLVFGLGGNLANPIDALYQNSLINLNLIKAASMESVRKIFFCGTVATYPFPYRNLPLKEDDIFLGVPHNGEYGYAVAKTLGYHFLEIVKQAVGIEYCIGLFTNMFGEYDTYDPASGHVVPSLIYKLKKSIDTQTPLSVWGNGQATRDFMYAKDATKASIFLMQHGSGLVNVASGKTCSIMELVNILIEISGFTGNVVWQKDAPTGISNRSVDISRLEKLGFIPKTDLFNSLRVTWDWYCKSTPFISE